MSAPKAARTTSRGRTYVHPQTAETAWSVTTLLGGGLPKRALMYWAAGMVAEFAVANRTAVEAMLRSVRLKRSPEKALIGTVADPSAVEAAIDYLKGAPWRYRTHKAKVGSAVHAEVEAAILGKPRPTPQDELVPYIEQFRRFEADFQPEWVVAERTVWNRAESYAGTLDWIARIGGRTIIGDTKTGADIYPEVALQLCAYWRAEFALMPDWSEAPLPTIDGAVVLHLREDGYRVVPAHIDDRTWDAFRYVREVFRWEEELSKAALGADIPGPEGLAWTFGRAPEVVPKPARRQRRRKTA